MVTLTSTFALTQFLCFYFCFYLEEGEEKVEPEASPASVQLEWQGTPHGERERLHRTAGE